MTNDERFWSKVDKHGPTIRAELGPCWVWTASTQGWGHGQFYYDGRLQGAHRVSWQFAHGPILAGQWVLHKCDNAPCVNPAHLYLGDALQNTSDAKTRGRLAIGDRNGSRAHPERVARGDRLPNGRATHCRNGHELQPNRKCPICRRAAVQRWRERNRDAVNARSREQRTTPEHRAKANAYQAKRRAENPEAYRAYMREYYAKRKQTSLE